MNGPSASPLIVVGTCQCYFHLEEYDDALRLALAAGDLFDITSKSEFVETLLCTRR